MSIPTPTQLFSIIVFGCISSQGWRIQDGKDVCLYNENANACNFGVALGVIGFLASMAFIVGEYLFEQMSSVKTRKHFVLGDLAFSALWAFLFFVGFCYLSNQWGKSKEPPMGYGSSNMTSAIVFSLFSIATWVSEVFVFLHYVWLINDIFCRPDARSSPSSDTSRASMPRLPPMCRRTMRRRRPTPATRSATRRTNTMSRRSAANSSSSRFRSSKAKCSKVRTL